MDIVYQLLQNAALLITFVYLALKLRDYTLTKKENHQGWIDWLMPTAASLLALIVMSFPFEMHQMRFDLRAVPVFFVAYVGGWRWGLRSAVIPVLYRLYLGGQGAWVGAANGILLAAVIGALYFQRRRMVTPTSRIDVVRIMTAFAGFSLMKSTLDFVALGFRQDMWYVNANIAFFSLPALFILNSMLNDANKTIALQNHLKYQAQHDPKTGLPNLRYFQELVKEPIEHREPVALAMVDIDFFKVYNDTHGHLAGDVVLVNLADVLKRSVRAGYDYVARFGGEEFVILFRHLESPEGLEEMAERIRSAVETQPFYGENTQPSGNLTISVGVSCSQGDKSMEQLIEEADKALYQAKEQGRNRVVLHSSACNAPALSELHGQPA